MPHVMDLMEDGLGAEVRAEAPPALEQLCRELALKAVKDTGVRPSLVAIVPRGRLPKTRAANCSASGSPTRSATVTSK